MVLRLTPCRSPAGRCGRIVRRLCLLRTARAIRGRAIRGRTHFSGPAAATKARKAPVPLSPITVAKPTSEDLSQASRSEIGFRVADPRDPPSGQDERVLRRQARRGVGLPCSSLHQCPASESHSLLRLLPSGIAVPWWRSRAGGTTSGER